MQRDQQLTLEQVSAAAGMTARNVRAYQTKGLIPPPTRLGRRSVYGPQHVDRLRAIERARSHGASLTLIASHLAAGRSLDDDPLVTWEPAQGPAAPQPVPQQARSEIGLLLAALDHQRDPAGAAHVENLISAGVFSQEGRKLYTGRDLAASLTALQRQGFPLRTALGIATLALTAAGPLADAVRASIGEPDGVTPSLSEQLALVACCVVRHVITERRST